MGRVNRMTNQIDPKLVGGQHSSAVAECQEVFMCAQCNTPILIHLGADGYPPASSVIVRCRECGTMQKASIPLLPEARWVGSRNRKMGE